MSFADVWENGYFVCKFKDQLDNRIVAFILLFVACAITAYLLGSINCGVLISRFYGKDVRESGSGNAGATNMTRTFGKKAGVMTFLGDFLKAAIALFIGRMIFGEQGAFISGIFCIIGHAFPLYFKFKGGKGVVCIAAMGLLTSPPVFGIMLAIFLIVLFGFKMVSFASVMTMIIYPFVLSKIEGPGPWVIYAIFASLLVVFLHRKNIARIFNHTESKISFGKKKDADDEKR